MTDITQLLSSLEAGNGRAADELLPLVYDQLRRLARKRIASEQPGQTLGATALVHEAYVRLVGSADQPNFKSRAYFYAAAAEAMRRILIESARRKKAARHGGGLVRQDLDVAVLPAEESPEEMLALDEALQKLAVVDKPAADVVRLRFFAGLPLPEIAPLMDLSPRTVDRLWAYARAWLRQELRGDEPQLAKT